MRYLLAYMLRGDNKKYHEKSVEDIFRKFEEMQKYINKNYQPNFNIIIDSIAICKKEDNSKWKVVEKFELQD